MLQEALDYLKQGWSVIPIHSIKQGRCTCGFSSCGKPGKHPRLKKWTEFQNRLPTVKEVKTWFEQWPDSNIATITGKVSNLVVVDIDDIDVYKKIFNASPTGMFSTTGSGGKHLFYEYPDGVDKVPNSVSKLMPEVDVRGDGGYVVLPPSNHASGGFYKWNRTKTAKALSEEALDIILNREEEPEKVSTSKDARKNWIEDTIRNGIKDGSRNDTIAKLAGYYAGKGMDEEITIATLNDWAQRKIKGYGQDFTYQELVTTVKSIFSKEKRKPVSREAKVQKSDTSDVLEHLKLDAFLEQHGGRRVEWAIENWLPSKTIHMVISPPETYKTWLLFDMAVSLASGADFLGHYPVAQNAIGPVLIIQQEDYLGGVAERLATISYGKLATSSVVCNDEKIKLQFAPSLNIYVHQEAELRVEDPEVMGRLENLIKNLGIKYVMIDPFYTIANLNNYGADALPYLMQFKELRNKYGVSFTIAHHTSKKDKKAKGGENITDREEGWGSQLINGWMETGWQVRKTDTENTILIRPHFKVAKSVHRPLFLSFDIATNIFPSKYKVTVKKELSVEQDINLSDLLREHGPMKKAEIVKMAGVTMEKATKDLKRFIEEGVIECDPTKTYAIIRKKKGVKF